MSVDNNRRIENIIRFGTIAEVDHAKRRARVQSGEILTDWLPWVAFRAGTTKIRSPVTVGEQCIVLAASGELTTAAILVGIYTLEFNTPSNSPDEHVIEFADGATITYNQANSDLTVSGIKTATVQAETKITLKTPLVECTKDLNVDGNAEIKGNTQVGGSVTAGGDVKGGSISLQGHTHSGVKGGGDNTGTPNG